MLKNAAKGNLGRDFWLFRSGQLVSVMGNACSDIALAWWVLDVTKSAIYMSYILSTAVFIRVIVIPFLGPLGDRFERKKLIIISDVSRGLLFLVLGSMAFLKYFSLPIVLFIYGLEAIGTGLFHATSISIVPQLVTTDKLQKAIRQTFVVSSMGKVSGGLIGGGLIALLGTSGAFFVNGISFFVATLATFLIKSDTNPRKDEHNLKLLYQKQNPIKTWWHEFLEGFRILWKVSVFFWILMLSMVMNIVSVPFNIALPAFIKMVASYPAWFLGMLYSSLSVGYIVGTMFLDKARRGKIPRHIILLVGNLMSGTGVLLIPLLPSMSLQIASIFMIGVGTSLFNVLLQTQKTLVTPDMYRSRLESLSKFFAGLIAPLGISMCGVFISVFGAGSALIWMGIIIIIFTPLFLMVPNFKEFFGLKPDDAQSFFHKYYQKADVKGEQVKI